MRGGAYMNAEQRQKTVMSFLHEADICVVCADVVDSTNAVLRKEASGGAQEGLGLLADRQTAGRGRGDHSFRSPGGCGIYMSILLRPSLPMTQIPLITPMTAVAVADAVMEICGVQCGIKWVNDLYAGEKKVGGILVEGAADGNGHLDYAVCGIGINVYEPEGGFPQEIQTIAGALLSERTDPLLRERLAASVLTHFFRLYRALPDRGFLGAYRDRSVLQNRYVTVREKTALVYGIDDDCRLLVRYADESTEALDSGEVSIRL